MSTGSHQTDNITDTSSHNECDERFDNDHDIIQSSALLPKESFQKSKQSYSTMDSIHHNTNHENEEMDELSSAKAAPTTPASKEEEMHPLLIMAVLSTSCSYGSIFSTLFLLTLPVECSRIGDGSTRSVDLGLFIFMAGACQLISPMVGVASDACDHPLGKRRPFLLLGTVMSSVGLIGMNLASIYEVWGMYVVAYLVAMLGVNVLYTALIALIPDLVSEAQTGVANGIFALLFVLGSLSGFSFFHYFVNGKEQKVETMYTFYNCFLWTTTILTSFLAKEKRNSLPTSICTVSAISTASNSAFGTNRDAHTVHVAGITNNDNDDRRKLNITENFFTAIHTALTTIFSGVSWKDLQDAYWVSPEEHHDFFVVTVSRTFYYMGISVQAFFMYFLHDIIHAENPQDSMAFVAATGFAAGAITAYPTGFLSDYFQNGRIPYVYASCAILACGSISVVFCHTLHQVMVLSFIGGGANGAYLTMDTSLAVDTLPSKKDAARFLGIWGVAGFVGTALGPMVGGPLLYVFGRVGNAEAGMGDSVDGYSIVKYGVILGMSSVYYLISAISLRWVEKSK